MTRIQVQSGMLASVDYNEAEQELIVEFNNGGEYKYSGVPKETYEALINAESVGKYFIANIKSSFPAEKL